MVSGNRDARPNKSTNDRISWKGARAAFRVLEAAAPALGAAWAERLFFRPPPSRVSPRVHALLASGRSESVRFGRGTLAAWSWGVGPRVVLVHGWGSRGGHMGAFVPPLLAAGFSAVAFDAPAHGASPGRHTNIPEIAAALRAVIETRADQPMAGVIAHSAGGVATACALRDGLALGRAVLLSPAARPDTYAESFGQRFGLGPRIRSRLRRRSERRLGLPWSALDVAAFAPSLEAPVLVVHDEHDRDVPWRNGAEVAAAWPGARFLSTRGLGHQQLLRDAGVVGEVVEFLKEAAMSRNGAEKNEVIHANG